MCRRMCKSALHVVQLFFIVACIYWWVLIPIIREVLFLTAGRDTAENVSTSLFLLTPVDVLFLEPEHVPANFWAFLLYYTTPLSELLVFFSTFFIAFFMHERIKSMTRLFIYFGAIFTVTVLSSFLQARWDYCFIAIFPALSGIGAAMILRPNTALEPTATAS